MNRIGYIFILLLSQVLLLSVNLLGQEAAHGSTLRFVENKGQWPDQVTHLLKLNAGDIYIEEGGLTFNLYDKSHYADLKHGKTNDSIIKGHAYKVEILGATDKVSYERTDRSSNYTNYFIGNDASKWATDVRDYASITQINIYDHIDLSYYDFYGRLKYDFIVHPYGNPSDIALKYNGVDKIKVQKGNIVLETNAGKVVEQSPYAYQIIDGVETKVACKYILKNNIVTFQFPEGYNESIELIIDPVLTFSTFTGSTASNFGCTATYDLSGNMYVGGTVFGLGYPTSTGAFQTLFAGGNIDMGISKFSADGSNLIYSTYIGGADNEIPHSLVVNSNDELCILGTTGSADYPVSSNAYDNTFNGGPSLNLGGGYGFNYNNGCDIVVTQLNAAGTGIIGSSFVGGTGNDGINFGSILHYNYGDAFRGEIIVDPNDNIIVASTTFSSDFPVSTSAAQTVFGGVSDACLFSLNDGLTTLNFSTYEGGTDWDAGYSVQINSLGEVFMTGGTKSSDKLTTTGTINPFYIGGDADGFLTHYNNNAAGIFASTYIGTTTYDQCFFVQLDLNDDVYVIGQTDGNYPILGAGYSNPNSGQFIQKITPDLSTSIMSTTIGRGSGEVELSITAFLVTDCDFIYFSAWGGPLNGNTALGAYATSSSTNLMPITFDAYQTTTDGSDFYICVLAPNASSLLYGSFFGGGVSAEHADGGTSRFDKAGNMYQAVCAGCGGNSDFPTTAGVWSNTNNSSNCNLGAFKFDLSTITPSISLPTPYVCIPNSFQFFNNSSGGNIFQWYFGDGDSSNLFQPAHVYADTGSYEVTLIVSDSLGCLEPDTAILPITVYSVDDAAVDPIDSICPGDSVLLIASGGELFDWSPPIGLSSTNTRTTWASPSTTTNYKVVVRDSCGVDSAYVTVFVHQETVNAMPDTIICIGNQIDLVAYGGVDYNWYPQTAMTNPNSNTPTVAPTSDIYYYVDITTDNGCTYSDSVFVTVDITAPIPTTSPDTVICLGDQIPLTASGGQTFEWYPSNLVVATTGPNTSTNITENSTIFVDVTNGCGTRTDSVVIEVVAVEPSISPDTIICPGDTALIFAGGGVNYNWTPSETVLSPNNDTTWVVPDIPTTYTVEITSFMGCTAVVETFVNHYALPTVSTPPVYFVGYGEEVTITGTTNADWYSWNNHDSTICDQCYSTSFIVLESGQFTFEVEDVNTCLNSDTTQVIIDGSLYVPNAFSPDGDGINEIFDVQGEQIVSYLLQVFDRWGLLLFESDDLSKKWDGTYKGEGVQMDTYVWKVKYMDTHRDSYEKVGHVTVVR